MTRHWPGGGEGYGRVSMHSVACCDGRADRRPARVEPPSRRGYADGGVHRQSVGQITDLSSRRAWLYVIRLELRVRSIRHHPHGHGAAEAFRGGPTQGTGSGIRHGWVNTARRYHPIGGSTPYRSMQI